MIQRILAASATAAAALLLASSAQADILRTTDGQWHPASTRDEMEKLQAEVPPQELLRKTARLKLSLQYDQVGLGNQTFSAGLVDINELYSSDADGNTSWQQASIQALQGFWPDAAASFADAAADLDGSARHLAMWKQHVCHRNDGDVENALKTAQQILEAHPKSFFTFPLEETRARILINRRDAKGARAALQSVIDAPGMNARDRMGAKLLVTYFFTFKPAAKDPSLYAKARKEYEAIVREIESDPQARKEATVALLRAKVGIGKCFVYEQQYAKAKPYFDAVVEDKDSLLDKNLLAQVYTGMGDIAYAMVKAELGGETVPESERDRIVAQLQFAVLHYLRVAKHYRENAGDEMFPATVGVARAWATQFILTGEKDCETGDRAMRHFVEAHNMLPSGEQKRLLYREAMLFKEKRDAACK